VRRGTPALSGFALFRGEPGGRFECMGEIQFTTMVDLTREAEVLAMMEALYGEDEAASGVDRARFPLTIRTLVLDPSRGRIVLFEEEISVQGYAVLIPFWSNEFGGNLVLIDELFVKAEARSRGIGRGFLEFVANSRPFDAVGAILEVSPRNSRARRLYESAGFALRRNVTLARRFDRRAGGSKGRIGG
jgi:GNAT superfamily N-acetyltransferase